MPPELLGTMMLGDWISFLYETMIEDGLCPEDAAMRTAWAIEQMMIENERKEPASDHLEFCWLDNVTPEG
jgi:hypothetical protein